MPCRRERRRQKSLDALRVAATRGHLDLVRLLIQHGADVNAKNTRRHTVLYCAGGHGHLEALLLLLGAGADCDAKFTDDGMTLLQWLAQYPDDTRYQPIVAALQRHKAGG